MARARISVQPDYLVLVNRAWRRLDGGMGYQVFHFTVREPLPCISQYVKVNGDRLEILDLDALRKLYGLLGTKDQIASDPGDDAAS